MSIKAFIASTPGGARLDMQWTLTTNDSHSLLTTRPQWEKEEGEKLASFFGAIYEFFNPIPVPVSVNDFVPVVLPARLVPVAFVPASSASFPHHCMTTSSSG